MQPSFFQNPIKSIALFILLCASLTQSLAQKRIPDSVLLKNLHYCGLTPELLAEGHHGSVPNGGPQGIVATAFPPNAIVTCGKFDLYYEDMVGGNQMGFNHPQFGAARRATFCAVLNYLESTFDFSNVSASNRIKVHVDTSYENVLNPAPAGTNFLAYASPQYPPNATGIVNGYMRDYIVTGSYATNAAGYQVEVRVNFDKTYDLNAAPNDVNFLDDYTQPIGSCNIDLFSTLLHEMGHAMGWFSLVKVNSPGNLLWFSMYNNLPVQPNNNGYNRFSGLDYAMYAGVPGGTMTRLINGTIANPALNTSLTANNNFWTNNGTTPNNHPVFSGLLLTGTHTEIGSYFSHLDQQLGSYSYRYRISPGEVQPYVMGPYGLDGATNRSFSKGELQTLQNALGYTINPAFLTANLSLLTNHPPFSTRMASYPSSYRDNFDIYETIPANYTITNNGTSTVVINLASAADRAASGISDLDGDPISVMPGTLVNFRGCGDNASNNHNAIAVSGNGQVITYTPRPGFYGRAQFGFSLTDGKDQGSFIVYTVDVKRGSNVTVATGNDLVVNGSFEAGTETKRLGPDELIPSSTITRNIFEQKFGEGYVTDGHPNSYTSNPWVPYGAGTIVKDAHIFCSNATLFKGSAGSGTSAFPNGINSAGGPNTGQRYQACEASWSASNHLIGMYYYLKNDVEQCHKYTLTFDAFSNGSGTVSVGFLNDITGAVDFGNPAFNYELTQSPFAVNPTGGSWQSYSLSFWYCGNAASNILSLRPNGFSFYIDNLQLTEEISPAPATVSVAVAPASGCTTQLTATANYGTPYHCSETYSWSNGMTGRTITVPNSSANATYTVTVSDGCNTSTGAITVIGANPITVTPNQNICRGASAVLAETGIVNPFWSPAAGLSCTSCATTTASPLATTTYTVSGTDNNGCAVSERVVVTVTPPPAITVSGNTALCQGGTTQLQASGAASYSWTPATGLSCTSCANPIASPTASTLYTVTGSVNGCTGSTSVNVTVTPLPVVTVSPTSASICAGGSVTLNASGATTYSWTPTAGVSCTVCPGVVVTPSATTTYTVTGTTNGCSNTAQATVTVAPCSCAPNTFGAGNYTTLTGTLSSLPASPSGNYYVDGSISFNGNVLIQGKKLQVAPGGSITVNPGATLDLSGTHIFTCPGNADMWKGIAVNSLGNTSGRLTVRDNSLIEDAVVAIAVNSPAAPASGNVLTVDNATFNRNLTAIRIEGYRAASASYPFSITRSVITCRSFGSFSGYPLSWPQATSLSAAAANGYQAPYQLVLSYPVASAKNGGDPIAGIVLENVGNTVGSSYYGATVGDPNSSSFNLMDNLRVGIEAHNSNVSSINNAFANMKPTTVIGSPLTLGNGIYADADPNVIAAMIQLTGANGNTNKFYDCVTGVEGVNLYEFSGSGALMTSSHLYPSTATGASGYKLRSRKYGRITLSNNSIYNIAGGIYFAALTDQGYYQGQISITGNTLDAHMPQQPTNNSHFMRQAIQLENLISCTNCGTNANAVVVQSNVIRNAYNGIACSNFDKQTLVAQLNTITLVADPAQLAQYGISTTNGLGNQLVENTVTAALFNPDKVRGYYAGQSFNAKLMCNRANDIDRGFEFSGNQPGVLWQANMMSNNNKGFVLNGVIGPQGSPSGTRRGYAASNSWLGSWSGTRYQTFTITTTDPNNSRLYVNSSGGYNPSNNWNSISRVQYMYSLSNGLMITTVANAIANCIPNMQPAPSSRGGLALAARGGLTFTDNVLGNQWMAQLGVWRSVLNGLEKASEDEAEQYRLDLQTLESFRIGAAETRFAWITDVENALNSGDQNAASYLLDHQPAASGTHQNGTAVIMDEKDADYLVENYAQYYRIVSHYQQDKLSEDDKSNLDKLANKCALLDGAVIYQARSLARILHDDPSLFWDDDACSGGSGNKAIAGEAGATGQQYRLSPNPNTGDMVLQQLKADAQPVKAVLMNAAGITVYGTKLLFENGFARINRSPLMPGLYLLQLIDSNGSVYNLKFIAK